MSTPRGCADPDACACRERVAELERKCAQQLEALSKVPTEAAKAVKHARADERERCLYVAPFMKTRAASDEAPQVCWKNGYNAGVAAYKTRIRALGDE